MRKITKKKAAIELSMNTIIIVTLSLVLLILGFFLIRNIMCNAIGFSDKLGQKAENELENLFQTRQAELVCFGGGQEPAYIAPGEVSYLWCKINAKESTEYRITIQELFPLDSSSPYDDLVDEWLINKKWEGTVSPNDPTAQKIGGIKLNEAAPLELQIRAKLKAEKRIVGTNSWEAITGTTDIDLLVKDKSALRASLC